jgi:hypothetical protein
MLSTCTKHSNALLGRQVKLTEGIFKKPIFLDLNHKKRETMAFWLDTVAPCGIYTTWCPDPRITTTPLREGCDQVFLGSVTS